MKDMIQSGFELRHLRYFMMVAEELHFGRAASRLCIAQPPLSQQIQQLEKMVGFALFIRSSRSVQLTPAGQHFLEDVRELFSSLDRSVAEAKRIANGETGRLRIGFVGTAAFGVLPAAMRAFREERPEVEVTLRELVTARQAQALREGRIHVGLARPGIKTEDIVCEPVLTEPLIAALPAGHPLADQQEIALEQLADAPFILFPRLPRPSYGDFLLEACAAAGFKPRVVQETSEIHTAIGLTAGGLGVTLLPASATALTRPDTAFVALRPPCPSTELCLLYPRESSNPALGGFLEAVRGVTRGELGRSLCGLAGIEPPES
jgi:DNA-binding transcriptional LysR family regulator